MKKPPNLSSSGELQSLATVLDEALRLLEGHGAAPDPCTSAVAIQSSLFEQCIELCRQVGERDAEPIRTIHHLSCTGGTLITKCLAAMPNVMVLNEVDPLSNMSFNPEKPNFTPSDVVALIRQGDNHVSPDLLVEIFVQNLEILRNELALKGKRLLLRDHSHSHFLTDSRVNERVSVLSMVADHFVTYSIVTVRNPLDSFLSLNTHGWSTFHPFTLDEYSRRYMSFLDAHDGLPIYRYEDFVSEPRRKMEQMCCDLKLAYTADFNDTFDVYKFSGDSGRSGSTIKPRTRRVYDVGLLDDAKNSAAYGLLVNRLGYESIC